MELFNFNIKRLLTFSYISGKENPEKICYIFSKESFSYISGNGNTPKIPYISQNGTFLYFRKGIFRTLA